MPNRKPRYIAYITYFLLYLYNTEDELSVREAARFFQMASLPCGIYDVMLDFEARGLVSHRAGEGDFHRAKYYRLTAKGRRYVEAQIVEDLEKLGFTPPARKI